MPLTWKLTMMAFVLSTWLGAPSYAQLGDGQQEAARVVNGMPPDVVAKVEALAKILQQGIQHGHVTDEDIRQGMLSGHLAEKLTQLDPNAGQLLEEISAASKNGQGPGEDSLLPLLGELGIAPN